MTRPDLAAPGDTPAAPTSAQLAAAAATFDLLSAPIRLHLVWLLIHQHYDVTTLADLVGARVATVSHHLAKLRLAGVVTAHRQGRHQLYTVDDPHVIAVVGDIAEHLNPDGTLTAHTVSATGVCPCSDLSGYGPGA